MSKKKYADFSDLGGLVYSTNQESSFFDVEKEEKSRAPQEQFLEAHFSKKGRGGKVVTVLKGFQGSESDLKALSKFLKNKFGVGGSVKNGEIIIQGNIRDKVIQVLVKEGYHVKPVGG